ncbi:unnamed protein product, partial [Brachionus calyciflorus]
MSVVCRHGVPEAALSDRGTNFQCEVIDQLLEMLDIHRLRTSAYHPQCDGETERFNQTIEQILTCYVAEEQAEWNLFLEKMAFAYNTSIHATTGLTPFDVFYADRNVRRTSYILGDRVWLLNSAKKKGVSKKLSRKWTGPFTVVEVRNENNYIIKPDKKGKRQLVRAIRLKKCFIPPSNVRYDSVIEYSQSQTKLDLNQTKNIEKPETDFVCLEPGQDKTMESNELIYANIENQNE